MRPRRPRRIYTDYEYVNGRYVKKDLFQRIHDGYGPVGRMMLYPVALLWYIVKITLLIGTGMFLIALLVSGWRR